MHACPVLLLVSILRSQTSPLRLPGLPACSYTYTAADVDRVLKEKKAKGQAPFNAGTPMQPYPRFALHYIWRRAGPC